MTNGFEKQLITTHKNWFRYSHPLVLVEDEKVAVGIGSRRSVRDSLHVDDEDDNNDEEGEIGGDMVDFYNQNERNTARVAKLNTFQSYR